MICEEIRPLLDAYVDQELSLESSLEIETHLEGCADCKIIYANRRTIRAGLQSSSLYDTAPEALRSRMMVSFNRAEVEKSVAGSPLFVTKPILRQWLATAAILVLVGLMGWHLGQRSIVRPATSAMQTELFESDLRSLMAPNHGIDIVSSNQHTVKPWFAGKLDFSPPVQDLSASGYPLLGGRRDYLGGRVVAALVYKRRQHWINLYIWPSDEESSPTTTSYRGYNIVHWSAKGMTDWAVSDLNGNELAQFGRLVEGER